MSQSFTVAATQNHFLPIRLMISLRWIAILGQIVTIGIIKFFFNFDLPVYLLTAVISLSVFVNFLLHFQSGKNNKLPMEQIPLYLVYDLGQLTAVLFLTGGLNNPFALLILAPVTIAAAVLSRRAVLFVCSISLVAIGVLALSPYPLPWSEGGLFLPPILRCGNGGALLIAIIFIGFYVWYVANQANQLSKALTVTQLALAREQKLSSLGALAAAAAHELGSPLSTITVVAKELLSNDCSPVQKEDLTLIVSQTDRCKVILEDLVKNFSRDYEVPFQMLPLSSIIELAAAPHKNTTITLEIHKAFENNEPILQISPELRHALSNILQNAFQFAQKHVFVNLSSTSGKLSIHIQDDGPGYPFAFLNNLGEPYPSGPPKAEAPNMGLGLFIAKTLLTKFSGQLSFFNDGGAVCLVELPR